MLKQKNEIELTREQLRQMQLIQLEILNEFDNTCRKNNICYSIDGGTLLGAVRHGGFIPWDDDIDIIMMRNDYEKFFNVCVYEEQFDTERFFLQDYRTDKYYNVGYARIRRNGTVYERVGHEHMKYVRGVFIDIFILDSVPDNIILRKLHCFSCFCLRKMLWSESAKVIHENVVMRKWYSLIAHIPRNFTFGLINRLADLCNKNTDTELIRHMTHPYPQKAMIGLPRNFLSEFIDLQFEGHKFMAIKKYDEYLTMLYGNYMKLPPENKQHVHIHLTSFSPGSV